MWSLTVLFISFVLHCVVLSVNAGYVFELLLLGYQNPAHRCFDGSLCERGEPNNLCDNAFKICFTHRDTSLRDDSCHIRQFSTQTIELDNDNLTFREGETIGGVDNPIQVTGDTWPAQQMKIRLSVYDIDGTKNTITDGSDRVTTFIIHPDLSDLVDGEFTDTYNITSHYSSLQLAFRLTCPPHLDSCSHFHRATPARSREAPTSVMTVSPTPTPVTDAVTVARPSPGDEGASLPLTLVVGCTVVGVILAITIVVVLLVILTIRKRNQEKTINSIDDSAFRFPPEMKCEDHLYETSSAFLPSSVQSPPPPPPPPVYAAVNAMYHMAQKDSDGMELEKNISYASVNVERNVAYGLLGVDPLHRPMMPLPDDQ